MKKFFRVFKAVFLIVILLVIGKYGYDMYQGYREERAAAEKVIKVACVGDSNTYHYGGNDVKELNYSYHLSKLLGDKFQVKNFGMPGTCVQSDLESPYTATRAYKASVEFEADVLIIMMGTNDIWEPGWRGEDIFYQHYNTLLDSYLEKDKQPKVYLCTIPALFLVDEANSWEAERERAVYINNVIRRIAEERGYAIIDIYEQTSAHPEWYDDDEIHLNVAAEKEIARMIRDYIKSN